MLLPANTHTQIAIALMHVYALKSLLIPVCSRDVGGVGGGRAMHFQLKKSVYHFRCKYPSIHNFPCVSQEEFEPPEPVSFPT